MSTESVRPTHGEVLSLHYDLAPSVGRLSEMFSTVKCRETCLRNGLIESDVLFLADLSEN